MPTIFRVPTLARSGQSFADPSPVTIWFAPVFPRSYNYRLRVVPPFRRSFKKKKISERKVGVGAPWEGLEKKDPFFSGSFLHKLHALFCFQWFFFSARMTELSEKEGLRVTIYYNYALWDNSHCCWCMKLCSAKPCFLEGALLSTLSTGG